jgi:hypothetical protein
MCKLRRNKVKRSQKTHVLCTGERDKMAEERSNKINLNTSQSDKRKAADVSHTHTHIPARAFKQAVCSERRHGVQEGFVCLS